MTPRDKLSTGRLIAANRFKYFRTALVSLVPKECPGLGTFGVTDTGVLLWDPATAAEWTPDEIAAVLVHEVSHLLRGHAARRKRHEGGAGYTDELWNKATDCEINDDLVDAKLKLPDFKLNGVVVDHPVLPQTYKMPVGLTAEEYLTLLKKQQQKQKQKKPSKGKKGEKEGKEGQDGDGCDDKAGDGEPHVGCGWCGSGAGRPLPNEPKTSEGAKGRTQVEIERVKRTVAEEIRKTVAQKGQGSVPAGWARWADELMRPPKVRWQDKLARITRGSVAYRPGAVDYHYTRPSRRQAGIGYGPGRPILPALRAPVPKVAVVQDTSGSMGTAELSAGLPEVDAILRATGARVDFVACDAAVHVLKPVRHWRELLKLMVGGGGTDFTPAFDALTAKRGDRPDVCVFVTDGYGTFPAKPPPYKVIWLLCGAHADAKSFPFGEVVELDDVPASTTA
jgi:predicted metal-dependent peptidase